MEKERTQNKLLIICPSMWPRMNNWGETQRMYYLANHLVKMGWQVYTVSPGFRQQTAGEEREQNFVSLFKGEYVSASFTGKQNRGMEQSCGASVYKLITGMLIPIVNWLYNEPNCTEGFKKQLWLHKYKKEILQFIEEKRIEKVLISVPAFSLMEMGKIIKQKLPQTVVIYDYRDPWYLWNRKKNFAWRKEKKYLRYADRVIGFSDVFSKDLTVEMGIREEDVHTVYNGYSEADWTESMNRSYKMQKASEKLRMVYTGNIALSDNKDNYRNVTMLIELVKQLPDMELYLVGVNDSHAGTTDGNVHFIGNVSQQESFHYMKTADVLLSIHDTADCSGKYLVSGKFYDYMRSGRVIWHIGTPDSLMAQWIRQYELGVSCRNNPKELQKMLLMLQTHWKKGSLNTLRTCDWEAIRKFSREYQNTKYESFLRSIDK